MNVENNEIGYSPEINDLIDMIKYTAMTKHLSLNLVELYYSVFFFIP